jgi:uncharacterized membrane protein
MEAFLVLLALAVVFGPVILSIIALVRSNRVLDDLKRVTTDFERLRDRIELQAVAAPVPPETPVPPADAAPAQPAAAAVDGLAAVETLAADRPTPEAAVRDAEPAPSAPSRLPDSGDAAAVVQGVSPADPGTGGLERTIASKWLVWLGAATVALGGTFLVKHSIESGWLGPGVRDLLGLAFGVILVLGGEWLRRRPLQRVVAALEPNYVPPALSSAGLFTIFASIYAAYALHGLIDPLFAFSALAATAFVAVGLSLLQGPLVALLGIVGGFVTPMLVSSEEPSAWTLFPYLLALTLAALAVLRYRGWWWLGYAALAGAAAWPLLWFAIAWSAGDGLPLGLYLLAVVAAFFYFTRDFPFLDRPWEAGPEAAGVETRKPAGNDDVMLRPGTVTWVAALAGLLLFFAYVRTAEYSTLSLVFLGLLALLYLFVGRREPALDTLAPAAAALVVALIATWHLPSVVDLPQRFYGVRGQGYVPLGGPLLPLELLPFAAAAALFGALFGAAGFATLWGARRPGVWAGISAGVPVLLFTTAYWRFVDFGLDLKWALAALLLAAVALAAATRIARYRNTPALDVPLGLYAAAVTAFIALGAAMTLREAWLTVAYALQVLALAYIYERVTVAPLRRVAIVVASVVLVRLCLNWNILEYDGGAGAASGWVLYGYGLPAVAFFQSARLFRRHADDLLVALLEAGWIAFVVLLASFEIRLLVSGSLTGTDYGLLEQSLQSAAWLAIAYALMQGHGRAERPVLLWASRILLCLAGAQVLLLQVLIFNPFHGQVFVGAYPVVNLLFLAYAVPAIFAFLVVPLLRRQDAAGAALVAAGFGFVLSFIYLTFEVRRAFQGPVFDVTPPDNAELYAYSAVWLAFALVLLGLAIWMKRASLRYASLIALSITVLKVFLVDTADLAGLYRVVSLVGLGLSLIAIGYIYQRFVFPPRAPAQPAAKPASPA